MDKLQIHEFKQLWIENLLFDAEKEGFLPVAIVEVFLEKAISLRLQTEFKCPPNCPTQLANWVNDMTRDATLREFPIDEIVLAYFETAMFYMIKVCSEIIEKQVLSKERVAV